MQRLIRIRHKDDFLQLKAGSLYHAIGRLAKAGLIEEVETSREGRRPERTVYRLTECGDVEALEWLRALLSKPVREPSQFVAAMSFVAHLAPEDARTQLEIRARELDCGIVALRAVMTNLVPQIGRVPLLEAEYACAMREAELVWVRSLIAEIDDGRIHWDSEKRLQGGCG
jgi:DNA-binding PadR family transcriptional regulator